MAISQCRTFLKQQIEAYDSNFSEWTDVFAIDNIPSNLLDKTYHIEMNSLTTATLDDSSLEDDLSVVVRFWRRGRRTLAETRDLALDDANCIRLSILDYIAIRATDNIRAVFPLGIEAIALDDTNDNTIQVELSLNLKLYYATT